MRAKPHTHAGWYASHPRVTLVAGADSDPERLTEFGADWHVSPDHLYADYRELLAREQPDLVSICAYAPDRVAMARAAIEAGAKGLWLEKAVACSMAEAAELRALADRAGVAILVNHMRRADPAWRRVAAIVAGHELGRLESVHVLFSGHFLHTGTHAWDALDEWCGRWKSVQCWREAPELRSAGAQEDRDEGQEHLRRARRSAAPDVTDPSGLAHIVFESGAHAFVSGSRKRYFIFEADLVFTEGRIRIANDLRQIFRRAPSPRYEGFVELEAASDDWSAPSPPSLLDELIEKVETGRERLTSFDDATRALNLGLALACAAERAGERVTPADLSATFRAESV